MRLAFLDDAKQIMPGNLRDFSFDRLILDIRPNGLQHFERMIGQSIDIIVTVNHEVWWLVLLLVYQALENVRAPMFGRSHECEFSNA